MIPGRLHSSHDNLCSTHLQQLRTQLAAVLGGLGPSANHDIDALVGGPVAVANPSSSRTLRTARHYQRRPGASVTGPFVR